MTKMGWFRPLKAGDVADDDTIVSCLVINMPTECDISQ